MKRVGYVQVIVTLAGMLVIAAAGAWFAVSQTGIDSAAGDTSLRWHSAVQRFVWELRSCYGCVALPMDAVAHPR